MRVVISGAAGGLGREVAQSFLAQPGAEVHGLVRSVQPSGAAPDGLVLHEVDLTDPAAIRSLTLDGPVDALIHCAAAGDNMSFDAAGEADWERFFTVNVFGAAALTKHLAVQFAARACVIFVNSGLGLNASPSSVPYSSSKAALKSLADSIRPEMNARGVSVTTVYPGQVATSMLERNVRSMGREWQPDTYIQPHDLAQLIARIVEFRTSVQLTEVVARPLREPW
ncbi:SDR family NAD(P)-dependent oxidoreductase [Cryobacterium arcticum]|uniref:Short-chain dehydrogenase n=1 Tax=Cryobacterium arcticum TaxID=670052 RepID=A0A318A7R1_9MICO|nr:SDR family NAD(P)-dependent oxidoreductase [Cryobacterium arcticum]PXA73233.1 hypothetical protein CTB96_00265 [Cryobacterium arcticum]